MFRYINISSQQTLVVKCKTRSRARHKGPDGEQGYIWGWLVNAKLHSLYSRERPGTHFTGGWVDPSTILDGC
jgi:hypothetical protein